MTVNPKLKIEPKMHSDDGIALLTVLALVATMSLAAVFALQTTERYVSNLKAVNAQSDIYWENKSAQSAGHALIHYILNAEEARTTDVFLEAQKPETVPTPFGIATIWGYDASNCFNINALGRSAIDALEDGAAAPAPMNEIFISLLGHIGISTDQAESMHDKLADWVDSDSTVRPRGAEDESYAVREHGHLAANRPFQKVSDLRVLEGFEPELLEVISPYLCAYHTDSVAQLNINTIQSIQAPLLAAFYSSDLDLQTAENIISARPSGGWEGLDAFNKSELVALLDSKNLRTGVVSTNSNHIGFRMELDSMGETRVYRYIYKMGTDQNTNLISRERLG